MEAHETTTEVVAEAPAHKTASEGTYFAIFLLLALLTLAELTSTYIPVFKVPLLLGLMVTKAWFVVSFYMHLRYDTKLFSWIILTPTIAGLLITIFLQPLVTAGYH